MVYMAPEYLTSGRVSDKVDAFSYGVVSYPSRYSLNKQVTSITRCHNSLYGAGVVPSDGCFYKQHVTLNRSSVVCF